MLYSLVENCRMQGIDPLAYLRDILDGISTHPVSKIAELTPRGWGRRSPRNRRPIEPAPRHTLG